MSTAQAAARDTPVVIFRSVNRDGETFAIEPRSLERLRAEFGPELHARPRVFIAFEGPSDGEFVMRLVAPHVVQLLTGLPEEKLRAIGGVTFRDPVTDRDVPLAPS
jgi:hypothetical protein